MGSYPVDGHRGPSGISDLYTPTLVTTVVAETGQKVTKRLAQSENPRRQAWRDLGRQPLANIATSWPCLPKPNSPRTTPSPLRLAGEVAVRFAPYDKETTCDISSALHCLRMLPNCMRKAQEATCDYERRLGGRLRLFLTHIVVGAGVLREQS